MLVINEYDVMGTKEQEIIFTSEDAEEAEEILEYYLEFIEKTDPNNRNRIYIDYINPVFKTYEEARIFFKK